MKNSSTFKLVEIVDESLYALHYSDEGKDELSRLIDSWTDPLWLQRFFEEHKIDLLSGFWQGMSVKQAIIITRKEAIRLRKTLIAYAKRGKIERTETLSTIFKPLYNNPTRIEAFEKNKAVGGQKKSWLRIYAIRIERNLFIITGGAIKLTPTMNEREHLLIELQKLEEAKVFLSDDENADYFIFEF